MRSTIKEVSDNKYDILFFVKGKSYSLYENVNKQENNHGN